MPSSIAITVAKPTAFVEGEIVAGTITIVHDKPMKHDGLEVVLEGMTVLKATAKLVGLFDALAAQPDPVETVQRVVHLVPAGTLAPPRTVVDFVVPLVPTTYNPLLETYKGRLVETHYTVSVDVTRGLTKRTLSATHEIAVVVPLPRRMPPRPHRLSITPDLAPASERPVPRFSVTVDIASLDVELDEAVTGQVVVAWSDALVDCVLLQIVSFEHLAWGGDGDDIWQDNDVQTSEVVAGHVLKTPVPFCVSLPRFACAPSVSFAQFAVSYALRCILVLATGHVVTNGVPVTLYRGPRAAA